MLQRLLFGLIAVASLSLVGCAHSPQQLSPQPKLTAQLNPVGRGQPVVVKVVDGRASQSLGTRVACTLKPAPSASVATISCPSCRPRPRPRYACWASPRRPTPTMPPVDRDPGRAQVPVAQGQDVCDRSHHRRHLPCRCVQRQPSLQRPLRCFLDQRFGMAPNQETNTKLVGDVLSDALTRLFKDPTIGQVLGE